MTSPFDPRNWLPKIPATDGPASWLDRWLDATTWWVEPAARAKAQMLATPEPERILAETVDGVARRFSGQRVSLEVHGRTAEGQLDSIRVFRKADRFEARLDVSDGVFDGVPIERATISVRAVNLEPGVPAHLRVDDIEINGQAHLGPLVTWLDHRIDDWSLAVDDGGAVVARPHDRRYRGVAFVVEGVLRDDELHLELRAGRWKGRRVGVPRWLRFTRTIGLPPFASGLELNDARVRGDRAEFRLTQRAARADIDLAALRDAIVRGTKIILR